MTGRLKRPRGGAAAMYIVAALVWSVSPPSSAQSPPAAPAAPATPSTAHAQAPFDLTGYWVSVVTQNWRYRMVVPGRGEYGEIPINLKAMQFADAWSPAPDEAAGKQCEAYGAAGIMRVPGRLHIGWRDEDTLSVETDAGMQTRLLWFRPTTEEATGPSGWQGHSVSQWMLHAQMAARGANAGRSYGSLQVMTDHMLPGLLRKNGLPYSAAARMTEYWEVNAEPGADQWLTVTSVLDDPEYLRGAYVFTSIFRKEADGSKWDPTPCTLRE